MTKTPTETIFKKWRELLYRQGSFWCPKITIIGSLVGTGVANVWNVRKT